MLDEYKIELESELVKILDYWMANTVDNENGGFYGKIDHFNKIIPDASKGAVLNARILWTFSAVFNYNKKEEYLNIAKRAYQYLKKYFYDEKYGGLIWEVDYKGTPLNTRKQIYAQGFGIYGFSEYYKASGDKESLELAISIFELIESKSFDKVNRGYMEAFDQEWGFMEDMRLSKKDENYPKSMNTHLHILEPYTNLYRVWNDDLLADKIKSLIRIFLDRIIDGNTGHFNLFFENNWNVKSQIVSYGHDIEGAWLLTEAAEVIGDAVLLEEVKRAAIQMTDATLNEGMDSDESLYNELNRKTGHLDTDKHWWPQAEAMVGLVNAYQISGNEHYLEKSMKVWQFIKHHMIDQKNGEWYWSVNKNGIPNVNEDKAGFWKCPYHNSRACLETIHRIGTLSI